MAQPVKEVTLTRVFDAPRELVFKAWTDPQLVAQWFGPAYFDIPLCEIDAKPWGRYLIHMRGPDGDIYPDSGVYQEVVAPERIVFTSCAFDDGQGGHQLETLNTLSLTEKNGRTYMTLHIVVTKRTPEVEGALAGMEEGWSQSFEKLEGRLAKTLVAIDTNRYEILASRLFDAPRELVFKIHTDPELIPQWYGPRKYTTVIDKLDLRPGGVWRFIQNDNEGNEYVFHGVYRVITPPERLVYTFEYEGMPGHPMLETITFDEYDGKTRVTALDRFYNLEDLHGMAQSGMESGLNEAYERADELLAALQKEKQKER
jgi:uncharacterized protein YndB with AHSA1/START domain